MTPSNIDYAERLLTWFADYGRDLPWRVKGGPHPDPYIVWISEIMLQQTTVTTVIPYFHRFLARYPSLADLALASLDDILLLWQGLGYYRRAHQLYACARHLAATYGRFPVPAVPEDLLRLPGIGPYTAASISALAFNLPVPVVDGNVARIVSRLFCLGRVAGQEIPSPPVPSAIREKAASLVPITHAADYTSAIMDLGALVCRPQAPSCPLCPWQKGCAAAAEGVPERYPARIRPVKPHRRGYVFWLEDSQGHVLVHRRSGKALLVGLYEFPWCEYEPKPASLDLAATPAAPETPAELFSRALNPAEATLRAEPIRWEMTSHTVRHTFTHFHLALEIVTGRLEKTGKDLISEAHFVPAGAFESYPFSRLMRKVIEQMATGHIN